MISFKIWKEIDNLKSRIVRLDLKLGAMSKEFEIQIGHNDENMELKNRIKRDLDFCLAATFPQMVQLLGSISQDLLQLMQVQDQVNQVGVGHEQEQDIVLDFDVKLENCDDEKQGFDEFEITPQFLKEEDANLEGINCNEEGQGGEYECYRVIDLKEWDENGVNEERTDDPLSDAVISTSRNDTSEPTTFGDCHEIKPRKLNVIRGQKNKRKQSLKVALHESCKNSISLSTGFDAKSICEGSKTGAGILSRLRHRVPRRTLVSDTEESINDGDADSIDENNDGEAEIQQESDSDDECTKMEAMAVGESGDESNSDTEYEPLTKKKSKFDIITKKKYSKKTYTCSVCSENCNNRYKLQHHVLVEHPTSYFELFGPQDVTIEEWMKCVNILQDGTTDNEFPYKCWVCERPFKLRSNVLSHVPTHSVGNNLQCHECGKKFKNELTLGKHIRLKHHKTSGKYPHTCACCNKGFRSLIKLQRHEKLKQQADAGIFVRRNIKNPRPPIVCSICKITVASPSMLAEHMRFHDGVKPLMCPHPACGKSFRQKSALNFHFEGKHTITDKYKCKICGKKFRWGNSLKVHVEWHDKSRNKILCTMCPMLLSSHNNLIRHIASVHTQRRPYSCHLCSKSFKQKPHLQYHLNTHNNPGGRQRGLNRVKS